MLICKDEINQSSSICLGGASILISIRKWQDAVRSCLGLIFCLCYYLPFVLEVELWRLCIQLMEASDWLPYPQFQTSTQAEQTYSPYIYLSVTVLCPTSYLDLRPVTIKHGNNKPKRFRVISLMSERRQSP